MTLNSSARSENTFFVNCPVGESYFLHFFLSRLLKLQLSLICLPKLIQSLENPLEISFLVSALFLDERTLTRRFLIMFLSANLAKRQVFWLSIDWRSLNLISFTGISSSSVLSCCSCLLSFLNISF